MALINQLDETATRAALSAWLPTRLPGASDVELTDLTIPKSSGLSMTTILFGARWTQSGEKVEAQLVARVEPTGPSLFPHPDLEREFRLLDALVKGTDIPLPTMRWLETDRSVLGAPFLVMDRVDGLVPGDDPPFVTDGWVVDLAPAQRSALFDNTLVVLDQLQRVDIDALGLRFLDEPELGATGNEQQIGWWRRMYDWALADEGTPSPTLEAAFDWAAANRPADDAIAVSWGDSRLGNVMFGDDQRIVAVLDWEMSGLADPQSDLGWFLLFIRYYSEGIGVPLLEGIPTREQAIAHWEELTGRTATDVDYHEKFAALRLGVIMYRLGQLMIAGGALPPGNPMPISNPASHLLARMLDLPAPEGDSANFVGNR